MIVVVRKARMAVQDYRPRHIDDNLFGMSLSNTYIGSVLELFYFDFPLIKTNLIKHN